MLSNDMEKDIILVGKHCMEQSETILSLCSKYSLFTTDIAAADSLCIYPSTIKSITLSPEEMLRFASFHSEHECLQKLAFSEASLLFIAKHRKIKVAVIDTITKTVCKELNINTINVQQKKSKIEISEVCTSINDSRLNRLSVFKAAACL